MLKFRYAKTECYHVDEQQDQALEVSYMVPVSNDKTPKDKSLTRITICVVGMIGAANSKIILKVLLDPSSTKTLINRKVVTKNVSPADLKKKTRVKTLAGTMTSSEMVILHDIPLPEFDQSVLPLSKACK